MEEFETAERFAAWVVDQTRRYTVNLEATPIVARDEILRAAEAWPEAVHESYDGEPAGHGNDGSDVSSLRCEFQAAVDAVFNVNSTNRAAGRKTALETVRSFIRQLQSDSAVWDHLGAATQFVLMLPVRKKAEMRALMEHLNDDFKGVWLSAAEAGLCQMQEKPKALRKDISSQQSSVGEENGIVPRVCNLRNELKAAVHPLFTIDANKRAAKRKGALACVRKFVGQLQDDAVAWEQLGPPTQFVLLLPVRKKGELRALMAFLVNDFKRVWWSAVEAALAQMLTSESRGAQKKITRASSARERERTLCNAYRALVRRWRSQTRLRTITIHPSVDGSRVLAWFEIAEPQTTSSFDRFGSVRCFDGSRAPSILQSEQSTQDYRSWFSLDEPRAGTSSTLGEFMRWTDEESESGNDFCAYWMRRSGTQASIFGGM